MTDKPLFNPRRLLIGLFILFNAVVFTIVLTGDSDTVLIEPLYDTLPEGAEHVLFIGNSHTFINSVPQMVQRLNDSDGASAPLWLGTVTQGGATLEDLSKLSEDALARRRWSFVVLQGASLEPFVGPGRYVAHFRALAARAEANGSVPILYQVWPRAHWDEAYGHAWMAADPAAANKVIRAVSEHAVETTGARLAPVSEVWMLAQLRHPEIKLYMKDGNHASVAGSYLAALMLYRTIRQRDIDPASAWRPENLSKSHAQKLQRLVNEPLVTER
ncbi:MAG: SGNH/GDSL hydrolase family protein [Bradymonadaceae bacterium]|nr:SGNH/GDSL hydrolase family protein [Lujinxingiaceae bacterium]